MTEWKDLRYSESITKRYDGCERIDHFVIRFAWSKYFTSEYREACNREVELFCNRLFRGMLKHYYRGKIVCFGFWEVGHKNGLHCHCIVGWPVNTRLIGKLAGLSVASAFARCSVLAKSPCRHLRSVWFDNERVDQRLVDYCLKEFLDSDNMYSDMIEIGIWPEGSPPREIRDYLRGVDDR